jgi:hypothetical protein
MVDLAIPEFGYQNHISADRRHRLIRRWLVTDAAAYAGCWSSGWWSGWAASRPGCGCSELAVRPGKCGGVKAKTLPDAAAAGGVEIPANWSGRSGYRGSPSIMPTAVGRLAAEQMIRSGQTVECSRSRGVYLPVSTWIARKPAFWAPLMSASMSSPTITTSSGPRPRSSSARSKNARAGLPTAAGGLAAQLANQISVEETKPSSCTVRVALSMAGSSAST